MQINEGTNHYALMFDDLYELVDFNESGTDYLSPSMRASFNGANDMPEAYKLARKGLPSDGIDGMQIAERALAIIDRELINIQFQQVHNVEGCDVDIDRYLTGEPECMIDYTSDERPVIDGVATIVVDLAYHCGISEKAIKERGHALMSLMRAIEHTGIQVEVWADITIYSSGAGHSGHSNSGRIGIRLCEPGKTQDPGLLMYALTHQSVLRAIGFNTMHEFPAEMKRSLAVGDYYGFPRNKFGNVEDYPARATFIPAMRENSEAGNCVRETLEHFGLLRKDI